MKSDPHKFSYAPHQATQKSTKHHHYHHHATRKSTHPIAVRGEIPVYERVVFDYDGALVCVLPALWILLWDGRNTTLPKPYLRDEADAKAGIIEMGSEKHRGLQGQEWLDRHKW